MASANHCTVLAEPGMSTVVEKAMGLPMSSVSSSASSSRFFIISSASFSMMRLRCAGAMLAQVPLSKAARAALTAASTSACSQAATLVRTWPVAGLMQSKVLPVREGANLPPMKAWLR